MKRHIFRRGALRGGLYPCEGLEIELFYTPRRNQIKGTTVWSASIGAIGFGVFIQWWPQLRDDYARTGDGLQHEKVTA